MAHRMAAIPLPATTGPHNWNLPAGFQVIGVTALNNAPAVIIEIPEGPETPLPQKAYVQELAPNTRVDIQHDMARLYGTVSSGNKAWAVYGD